jgi:3-hydroxyisobutyrate dehydrogenase-like beta-hydroxyacid dehydrogenase
MNPPRQIGYIGLGTMGSAMAANLAKAGFKLTVWNRNASKSAPFAALGVQVADSLATLAKASPDAIFLNLSDGPAVSSVLFGEGGLAPLLSRGCCIVDNSTTGPGEAQQVAAKLRKLHVDFLDAPVSGGKAGAEQGTLSIMVGGDEAVFQRLRVLFDAIGKITSHMGPVGMGQACKACNQIAVICNLLGVCEAAALAKKLGLDHQRMLEVVKAGGGASRQLDNYGTRIFAGDLSANFALRLMLKDLVIIRTTADSVRLPLNGTAVAESYLRAVAANGGAELGTQAMSKALELLGGFHFAAPAAPKPPAG